MKIEFSTETERDNVVFDIVAENNTEMALLSVMFSGPKRLEMEGIRKYGKALAHVRVRQAEMEE